MGGGAEGDGKTQSFNILSIADLGGATIYESSDNLIGLARYIRKQDPGKKPDILFIGGGLIPFFPRRGSNRSNDYLDAIRSGLKSVRDAAAAMKPHTERLLRAMPENAVIIYTLGEQDTRNIDEYIREIGLDFKSKKRGIENRMQTEISFIMGRKSIISTTEASIAVLREDLKNKQLSNEERSSMQKELKNAIIKARINKEELKEAQYKLKLINQLYALKLSGSNKEALNRTFHKKMEQLKEIRKELSELKSGDGEYEEVASRAKKVANEIRMLSNRLSDIGESEKIKKNNESNAQIDIFIHNSLTPKDSHDIITELAKFTYLSELKDAFGRKRKVHIQSNMLEVHEAKKGPLSFNIITAYDLDVAHLSTRKSTSNDHVADVLNKLYVNGAISGKNLEAKPLNVLLTAKKNFTSFSIDPLLNNSNSALVSLSQGPFWDIKKGIAAAWEKGINTKETQTVQKVYLSSGASQLAISDRGPRWSMLSNEYLSYMRGLDDKEEDRKMKQRIAELEAKGGKKEVKSPVEHNGNGIEHNPVLDKIVRLNKRFSEMNQEDFSKEIKSQDYILPYRDTDLKSEYKPVALSIAAFSDGHMGSHSLLKVLSASIDDALKRKPQVLALLGDMIEGFLNDYSEVMRYGMEYDFPEKYEKALSEIGVPKEKRAQMVSEKLKEKLMDVRYNADEQPRIVMEKFTALVYDVISREGAIYIIAGNHDNKSGNEGSKWHRDEAVSLSGHVKTFLDGIVTQLKRNEIYLESKYNAASDEAMKKAYSELMKENVERIKIFEKGKDKVIAISGSDYGADERVINGVPIMLSHEMGWASESSMLNFVERKQTKAVLAMAGHDHILTAAYAGGKLLLKVQSNQDSRDNPYTKRIPTPIGDFINGYSLLDIEVNKKSNSIFKFELQPVLGSSLLRTKESLEERAIDEKVRSKLLNVNV